MNTLSKILKQDLLISEEMTKLQVLKKKYVEEQRLYPDGMKLICSISKFDVSLSFCVIIGAKYTHDGKFVYLVNKLNKDGTPRKGSRAWRPSPVYKVDPKLIEESAL